MKGNAFLRNIQQQVENDLLAQEQVNDQVRRTGQEAPAKILSMLDTGVRIGDAASMLRFSLEVFPREGAAFRADAQNSISDLSRPKFVPGATIYVKFDPRDTSRVVIDHAPVKAPKAAAVTCRSCGATQKIEDGQSACNYCGKPVP